MTHTVFSKCNTNVLQRADLAPDQKTDPETETIRTYVYVY